MKILIAGDHHTVEVVKKIEKLLREKGMDFDNVGTMDTEEKISLQQMIPAVTKPIQENQSVTGILVCGTGAGVEIGANRFKGIRASLCASPKQAEYARIYDNANVLCLSSWITENPEEIINVWLTNNFDGNEKRMQMLKDFDEWN